MKRFISQLRWPLAIGRVLRSPDEGEQSESDSRARHDRAFLYLSRCALRSRDGASVLGDICRITARALRVDHVHIVELLPDERTLIARAASGWAPERLALWQFDLAPESRLGQAVRNSALIVLDGGTEPGGLAGGSELLRDLHMRSGLVTGVSAAPGSYALFGVYSIEPRRFTREELQFVRGVGHIVESTLERCVRAETEKAARVTAHAEQADLLRIVVGRLGPALRESIGQLSRFRTSPTDTFTFRRAVRQTERQVAAVTEFIEDLQLLSELLDGWHPGNEAVLLAPLLASIVEQLGDRAQAERPDAPAAHGRSADWIARGRQPDSAGDFQHRRQCAALHWSGRLRDRQRHVRRRVHGRHRRGRQRARHDRNPARTVDAKTRRFAPVGASRGGVGMAAGRRYRRGARRRDYSDERRTRSRGDRAHLPSTGHPERLRNS